MRTLPLALALTALFLASHPADAATSKLLDPTKQPRADQVIRLKAPAPGKAGTFVVKEDGIEIPY